MKTLALITIAIFGFFAYTNTVNAIAVEEEKEAVKEVLRTYFKGHETGKGEFMKMAMHPEGKLMYIGQDKKYQSISFPDYIERMPGKSADDESQRKRSIESVEVTGNVAVGKLILNYPTVKFVDYMTLLKIDGKWMIVNKAAHSERIAKD